MGPIDAVWHLVNFFAPAVFVGITVPLLARLVWRRELRSMALRPAIGWAVGVAAFGLLAGLLLFGRDGKMGTYAAMATAVAASVWWRGFRPGR